MIFFKARTPEAYNIKGLCKLLQNGISVGCFVISKKGINLCMSDKARVKLYNVNLYADNFTIYKYRRTTESHFGINMSHFHQMLKTIKKRDSIELFIDEKEPTDFGIKVIPKEGGRTNISYVKVQEIQNIKMGVPEGYSRSIIVNSSEYQKMCKSMSKINNEVKITSKAFQLTFSCNDGGLMRNSMTFGDPEDSDSDDDDKSHHETYEEDFEIEHLVKTTEISILSQNMKLYPKEGLPLLIKSNIGSLGDISIYIKSKQLVENEARLINSDDDD